MMEDKAYKYARNLLFEIFRRECPEKEVEALDDTIGVLTQIDHMTAHLFSRIEALTAERNALKAALNFMRGCIIHAKTELAQSSQDMSAIRAERALARAIASLDLTPDTSQIDAIRAALEAAHDAIADYPRAAPDDAEWMRYDEQIEYSQSIIRALDPAAIAAKLKGDDNDR